MLIWADHFYNLIFILKILMSKKKYAPLIYYLKCLYLPHYLYLYFITHLFLATKVPSIFDEGNFLFVVESREAPQYTVGKRYDKSDRL